MIAEAKYRTHAMLEIQDLDDHPAERNEEAVREAGRNILPGETDRENEEEIITKGTLQNLKVDIVHTPIAVLR